MRIVAADRSMSRQCPPWPRPWHHSQGLLPRTSISRRFHMSKRRIQKLQSIVLRSLRRVARRNMNRQVPITSASIIVIRPQQPHPVAQTFSPRASAVGAPRKCLVAAYLAPYISTVSSAALKGRDARVVSGTHACRSSSLAWPS